MELKWEVVQEVIKIQTRNEPVAAIILQTYKQITYYLHITNRILSEHIEAFKDEEALYQISKFL